MNLKKSVMRLLKQITIVSAMWLSSCVLHGQNGVMVQILDMEIVPKTDQGTLRSSSVLFQELINLYSISEVSPTFPASKRKNLQQVFSIYCNCDEISLLADLAKHNVLFANPELTPEIHSLHEPNDYNEIFATDYALDLIDAKGAWAITTGSASVEIGITDSNYDIFHMELVDKFNFVQSELNHPNLDHGTAVAVTAAGGTNNGIGKSSIGYNSSLRLYGMGYNNMLIASYDGARIINASWAGGCFYSSFHQQVIDEIIENGSIIVAAAGNGETCGGSSNLVYPASYRGVISVTSIGPNNNHERYPGNSLSTHQHNAFVDISAPGYDVPVALRNNQYGTSSGTSFAAPFVSGTIGLMLALHPNLNHCEVEYLLKSSSVNIDSLNPNYAGKMGAGRLDSRKTLENTANFTPLQTSHKILYSYQNPTGEVVLDVNSDLPVSSLDYEFISAIQLENGNYYQEYELHIIYETGCSTKFSYFVSEDDFYNDSLLILPVDLVTFEVTFENNNVLLSWETINESGIQSYEIHSSADGLNWDFVGEIHAYNREAGGDYQLIDVNYEYTLMYYQLRRVDIDGQKSTIGIQSLHLSATMNELSIYPNPAVETATFKSSETIEQINLYNTSGQLIETLAANGTSTTLNVRDLSPGIYHAVIYLTNGKQVTEKLMVQ
jgi:hypothetical protein